MRTLFCRVHPGLPRIVIGFLLLAFGLAGCGGRLKGVNGTVTRDGNPVPNAEILFASESDPAETFYGLSLEDGKYHVDSGPRGGLKPGNYKVTVTWYTDARGRPLPPGEEGEALKMQGLEMKATLTKEVGDAETIDLDLTGTQPTVRNMAEEG